MSQPTNGNSGKRLILGILVVAILAAGLSWWFRYSATHRTVEFWGPTAARLIRDAPRVTLRSYETSVGAEPKSDDPLPRDISHIRGLTHLRTALLQDRSYDWSAKPPDDSNYQSSLVFEDSEGAEPRLVILLSPDFKWAANGSADTPNRPIISCSPIAGGLKKFFTDALADSPTER